MIDVNVNGVFHTVRAALPALIERKGYVLVVSSLAAYAASPGLVAYNASKAGAEHFANALRPEVGSSASRSAARTWAGSTRRWSRTPRGPEGLQQDAGRHARPAGQDVSVETCADAFVEGIAKRKTRVSVPGWVNAVRWLKPALTTVIGERETARRAPEVVPLMDQEVLALGRSMSARTAELERQPEAASTS